MKQCGLWMCYLFSVVWQTFDPLLTHKKKELAGKTWWTVCPADDSSEKIMSWMESLFQPLYQKIPFIISLCFETYILTINYVQFWSCTNFESLTLVNIYIYNILKYFWDSYSFLTGLEISVSSLEKVDNANQTEMKIKFSVCLYYKCCNCTLYLYMQVF